jgi:hypothetical protein
MKNKTQMNASLQGNGLSKSPNHLNEMGSVMVIKTVKGKVITPNSIQEFIEVLCSGTTGQKVSRKSAPFLRCCLRNAFSMFVTSEEEGLRLKPEDIIALLEMLQELLHSKSSPVKPSVIRHLIWTVGSYLNYLNYKNGIPFVIRQKGRSSKKTNKSILREKSAHLPFIKTNKRSIQTASTKSDKLSLDLHLECDHDQATYLLSYIKRNKIKITDAEVRGNALDLL